MAPRSWPEWAINRYSGFICTLPYRWAEMPSTKDGLWYWAVKFQILPRLIDEIASTKDVLYQLSYVGIRDLLAWGYDITR